MKNLFKLKFIIFLFVFCQITVFSQDNRIKIYESKSGNSTCAIVFPNDSEPLIVITGKGDCTISKTMAMDDWQEMSASTIVTTSVRESPTKATALSTNEEVMPPRDIATGQSSGKRQHKPYQLSTLSLDVLDQDSDGDGIEIYSFSWGMSNSGNSSAVAKAGYNVKSNVKARTLSPSISGSCCSNGVCTVTVSVDKKHTKSGHVTLLK